MKTYAILDGVEYIGSLKCDNITLEQDKEFDRYIFHQGKYSTIIRTKNNINIKEID